MKFANIINNHFLEDRGIDFSKQAQEMADYLDKIIVDELIKKAEKSHENN